MKRVLIHISTSTGFTFPVAEHYLEDVLEMTNFRLMPKRPAASAPPEKIWHKFTARGKSEKRKVDDYEGFIAPFLRDISGSGKFSRTTIESLSHPNSEDLNLELIATLVRFIHEKKDEGAVLVFLSGQKFSYFYYLYESHSCIGGEKGVKT